METELKLYLLSRGRRLREIAQIAILPDYNADRGTAIHQLIRCFVCRRRSSIFITA